MAEVKPTPELLLSHAKAGPRYTSYPTAPEWTAEFREEEFHAALGKVTGTASVYVHIPFCKQQCTFCGCNMVVAGRREPGDRYLDALERQVGALPLAHAKTPVSRIHLGGGTPTWLDCAQLERLYSILFSRFTPTAGAELSVEADPEVTTDAQVDTLARLGVNRFSMGVQSFDPTVLAAVNRPQEHTRVHAIMDQARGFGMSSHNLDLMYGLPLQTLASFRDTLEKTLLMRPDRLAIFGYAHVPWLKAHMKSIDGDALPGPVARMELFLLAHELLGEAGYQAIGMDHFALADDELVIAQGEGRLHRNFMGYTTEPDLELIGLGMSAISELSDCYVQQKSRLNQWWDAVEQQTAIVEKGCWLTAEDKLRREVINRLMCNLVLPYAEVEARHGIDFQAHFSDELAAMAAHEATGLVERHADKLVVTELGRLLMRNVCMDWDAHFANKKPGGPRFSQTV
jgi:oxygen-independent coproporphyrinogen-3 oxidase